MLLSEIKSANVFEHKFLIRKVATRNFSCNLLLLSFRQCSEYIVLSLERYSQNLTGSYCLWIHVRMLFNMFVNFERIFLQAALVDWFLRMLKKQACLLILYVKKLIKMGRFSSQDEVFIWKILSLLLPGRDAKHPGFIWT